MGSAVLVDIVEIRTIKVALEKCQTHIRKALTLSRGEGRIEEIEEMAFTLSTLNSAIENIVDAWIGEYEGEMVEDRARLGRWVKWAEE